MKVGILQKVRIQNAYKWMIILMKNSQKVKTADSDLAQNTAVRI